MLTAFRISMSIFRTTISETGGKKRYVDASGAIGDSRNMERRCCGKFDMTMRIYAKYSNSVKKKQNDLRRTNLGSEVSCR